LPLPPAVGRPTVVVRPEAAFDKLIGQTDNVGDGKIRPQSSRLAR
jgi:hypothetical protein